MIQQLTTTSGTVLKPLPSAATARAEGARRHRVPHSPAAEDPGETPGGTNRAEGPVTSSAAALGP